MFTIALASMLLIAATTVLHYEVLGSLSGSLPRLRIPHRSKLLVVIFGAFVVHGLEIALYGGAYFVLAGPMQLGQLSGPGGATLLNCMYFSAETYTSLGFGDIVPGGPLRLLAGVEALNGLLLIGWSASFAYLAMERFWNDRGAF